MPPKFKNKVILIAGLTASGKSRLALDIALSINRQNAAGKAVIINADSMQVYDGLRILTARPPAEDLAQVPHYLYGFVDPACRFSAGAWLKAVEDLLRQPEFADKTCIFVGGTGLYFRALLGGLAEIPPVNAAVRQKGQDLLAERGLPALYADLKNGDPLMAERLSPQDSQRIIRAWEVWQQTGQSLSLWQANSKPPLIAAEKAQKLALLPPREAIYARINARADKMVEKGALQEVEALRAGRLDLHLPLMKAAGVREFCAYLDGAMDLPAAIEKIKQETRNYAKRQRTWFSRQLAADWRIIENPSAF